MKTIYNTYVVMESQEQCDKMKQLCIDNKLKLGTHKDDYKFVKNSFYKNTFRFSELYNSFNIWWIDENLTEITEQEFIKLLKNTKL